jgi:hypothetical protein
MPEYLNAADVTNRLTDTGVEFVADRNQDGAVSTDEVAAYITTAIAYAGNLIDAALTEFLAPALARGSGNGWLKDRGVDIAAFRAAGQGGDSVPPRLTEDFEFTMRELDRIRGGARVPGLVYPTPPQGHGLSTRIPRAINPR